MAGPCRLVKAGPCRPGHGWPMQAWSWQAHAGLVMAGPCRFSVSRSMLFTLSSWKYNCVCSDTVLSCAWVLLLVAGTSCQAMTELVRRAAFKKKERRRKEVYESNFRRFMEKRYTPFPTISLFKQLRVSLN